MLSVSLVLENSINEGNVFITSHDLVIVDINKIEFISSNGVQQVIKNLLLVSSERSRNGGLEINLILNHVHGGMIDILILGKNGDQFLMF